MDGDQKVEEEKLKKKEKENEKEKSKYAGDADWDDHPITQTPIIKRKNLPDWSDEEIPSTQPVKRKLEFGEPSKPKRRKANADNFNSQFIIDDETDTDW